MWGKGNGEREREENWMEEGGFARERDCDLIGEFEKGRNVLNSIFFRVCANLEQGSFFNVR